MSRRVLGAALSLAALVAGTVWWSLRRSHVDIEVPRDAVDTGAVSQEVLPIRTGVLHVTVRSFDTGQVVPGQRLYASGWLLDAAELAGDLPVGATPAGGNQAQEGGAGDGEGGQSG